jgi:uncharacterized protein (TIGR03083 family)
VDYDELLFAARREAAAFITAMGAGPLDTPIPSCPDWTMADLVVHVGEFAGWWADILAEGTGRPKLETAGEPADGDAVDWCAGLLARLTSELEATPAATEIWTWVAEDKTARFAARRGANELAIHRFDAQLARGAEEPIDGALAIDGIDEIFLMIANQDATVAGNGETLHLHATDLDAEWLLTFGPEGIDVRHEHAKGDAAIRGAVSDLELLLYGRPLLAPIEQFGDDEPLQLFHRIFQF